MARRPTAMDVAKLANTSRSAVSMVINQRWRGIISEEAEARIRASVAELNYVPHTTGRSLRTQRTLTLGVVTEIVSHPFAGALISGLTTQASSEGYAALLVETDRSTAGDEAAVAQLVSRQVDGLIYATGGLSVVDLGPQARAQSVVLANCFDARGELTAFVPDNEGGTMLAVQHLLDLGHKRIALLLGDGDDPAISPREAGYRAAMAAARIPLKMQATVTAGWDIDGGYRAAERVLGKATRPTAIVASNDRVATGVLLRAASMGLSVPDDLSIVGFDDQPFVADRLVPALTTIALPYAEMGAAAARALIESLSTSTPSADMGAKMACHIVVRQSTAPPS